jgi:putative toxin-antitoxin system antitoxin component (TIGR02293 family)
MSISQFNLKLVDTVELVKISRKGITISLFEEIVNSSSYTLKEWSKFLHITERTIQRYKKEKRKFESLQSERIIEIAKLQLKGKEVFGSKVLFDEWMNSKIIALGNIRPIELLDSSFGIDMLMDELGRIEHGILA